MARGVRLTTRVRSITRLTFSRLVSVSVCLCAFALLPFPQLAVLTWAESVEGGCPFQADEKSFKEELVVWSSARRRLNHRRHVESAKLSETGDRLHPTAAYAHPNAVIVGHRLANGLRAPLLI